MNEERSNGLKVHFFEKMEFYILLALLLLILFKFDEKSAINFLKILIIFTLSSIIIKTHFFPIIEKLIEYRNKNIYENMLSTILTVFIFLEIEFLLNKEYPYAFCVFVCFLVFTGGVLYLLQKESIARLQNVKTAPAIKRNPEKE